MKLMLALVVFFTTFWQANAQNCRRDPSLCNGNGNGRVIRDRRDIIRDRDHRDRDHRDRDRDRRDRDVRPLPPSTPPHRDRDRDRDRDRHRDVRPLPPHHHDRDRDVRPLPPYRDDRDRTVVRHRRDLRSWDRTIANRYHQRHHHRPHWNNPYMTYTRYHHSPYIYPMRDYRRYYSARDYFLTIPYRYIYWNTWLRYRTSTYDGFQWLNGYPYYVYNGYQHRYSSDDRCNYELVDGYSNTVVRSFAGYSCRDGYDYCADLRDDMNYRRSGYQYFCSERVDNSYGGYTHWDYNDDFYTDVWDEDDYYNNDYPYYDGY